MLKSCLRLKGYNAQIKMKLMYIYPTHTVVYNNSFGWLKWVTRLIGRLPELRTLRIPMFGVELQGGSHLLITQTIQNERTHRVCWILLNFTRTTQNECSARMLNSFKFYSKSSWPRRKIDYDE